MACKKKARQGGSTGSKMKKKGVEKEMRQGGSTGSKMRKKSGTKK